MLITRFIRIRLGLLLGIILVTGIAAAAVGHYMSADDVTPEVQRGTAFFVSWDADAIGFRPDGQRKGIGLVIGSAIWADRQGTWHIGQDDRPECLVPPGGQRIELGVLHVRPAHGALGGPIVAWIRCL